MFLAVLLSSGAAQKHNGHRLCTPTAALEEGRSSLQRRLRPFCWYRKRPPLNLNDLRRKEFLGLVPIRQVGLDGSWRSPGFWEATSGQQRRRCPAPRQGCQTRHCRRCSRLALPRRIGLAPFCHGFHLLQPALPLSLFHERTPPLYPAGLAPAPPRRPRRHHPWAGGYAAQAGRSRRSCPRPHWAEAHALHFGFCARIQEGVVGVGGDAPRGPI